MTIVRKPAASLLPGEVITEYPFDEPGASHQFGDAVRWRVLGLPVDRLGTLVIPCVDEADGGDMSVAIPAGTDVTVQQVDPRIQWVFGAGMRELVRLAVKVSATAPAAFDRAVAEIETTPAKETTR